MSTFWQVFAALVAAWVAIRVIGNWMLGKVLKTTEKASRLKIASQRQLAIAIVDEMERRSR